MLSSAFRRRSHDDQYHVKQHQPVTKPETNKCENLPPLGDDEVSFLIVDILTLYYMIRFYFAYFLLFIIVPIFSQLEWVINDFAEFSKFSDPESIIWLPSKIKNGWKFDVNFKPAVNVAFELALQAEDSAIGRPKLIEMTVMNWDEWEDSILQQNDKVDGEKLIWTRLLERVGVVYIRVVKLFNSSSTLYINLFARFQKNGRLIGPKGQIILRLRAS